MPADVSEPTRKGWRRASAIVLGVTATITVAMIALLAAMFVNDSRIEADQATATATVLSVSALRTGIEFVDAEGVTIRPAGGVLYPGLLSVDQQFVVEYSASDPTIVRVAGRTAMVGVVMVAAVVLVTWLLALPLAWLLRRQAARGKRGDPAPQQAPQDAEAPAEPR